MNCCRNARGATMGRMPAPFDLVIQNGTVVNADGSVRADVGISGQTVAAIGPRLAGAATIDAGGLLVIPGGVDPHVHLQYPQGPHRIVSSDDWLTGTIAAAHGGTTTVIDFVEARLEETWLQALEARLAQAASQAVLDFSLSLAPYRADARSLAEVGPGVAAGLTSFQIFMAYDGIRLTGAPMLPALDAIPARRAPSL